MNIDGVITAATDYGVLTTSYIAEKLGLKRRIHIKVCKIIKNKYLVRKILAEQNVDSMHNFFEIRNINDLNKITKKLNIQLLLNLVMVLVVGE